MNGIVRLENLYFSYSGNISSKVYPENWVLKNINFSLDEGEFVVIAGANGSGKSTLLRLIDLLYPPTRGNIFIFGKDISSVIDPYEIRSKIGFVFQDPKRQMITTTVLDEIVFGPENLGIPRIEIEKRVNQSVNLTGIKSLLTRRTDELSGGQRQLVSIASVLTMEPEILLFDEPTSMLHPEYHNRIIEIIKNLNKLGKTIILVTHNNEDFTIGDRCFVMKMGSLIYNSDPKGLFENYINTIEEWGLESPFSVRVSCHIREKLDFFPLCMSMEDLLNETIDSMDRVNG